MQIGRRTRQQRVLLIQPPVLREAREGDRNALIDEFWDAVGLFGVQKGDVDREPNHGLLHVASVLLAAGWDVDLLELNAKDLALRHAGHQGLSWDVIQGLLAARKCDYVGVSCLTPNYYTALELARAVRRLNPEAFVFMGGIFPTFWNRKVLLDCPDVDAVVVGEGEDTVVELLTAVSRQTSLAAVKGIAFRNEERPMLTPRRLPVKDLDALPPPAYHLLPPESEPFVIRAMLQRGCVFGCTFCSPREFCGHPRSQDPVQLAEKIVSLLAGC